MTLTIEELESTAADLDKTGVLSSPQVAECTEPQRVTGWATIASLPQKLHVGMDADFPTSGVDPI